MYNATGNQSEVKALALIFSAHSSGLKGVGLL